MARSVVQPMLPGLARRDVALKDGAEGALDGADVRVVEDRGAGIFGVNVEGHGMPPCRTGAGGEAVVSALEFLRCRAAC